MRENNRPILAGSRYIQWLTAFVVALLIASCGSDPAPVLCKPIALQLYGDSVAFVYDDGDRPTEILYYNVLGRLTKKDELSYNGKNQLVILRKTTFTISGGTEVSVQHTLGYNDAGLPSLLTSSSLQSGVVTTEFKHNELGQLTEAITSSDGSFVGATRYEYNEAGNIPKVYYKILINQKVTEVVARENQSFDDGQKFYISSPFLKVLYEYVYSYLPNANNCLSAKVYYYSYVSRFANPLIVNFTSSYNSNGLIQQLEDPTGTKLNSSEILFERALYRCD